MLIQETRSAVHLQFFASVIESIEPSHLPVHKISRIQYLLNLTEYFGKIMFVGDNDGRLDQMDQPKANISYFIQHYFPEGHNHIEKTMLELYDNCIFQVVILRATRIEYIYDQQWITEEQSIQSGTTLRHFTVINLWVYEQVLFESIVKIATSILEGKSDKIADGIKNLL